MRAFILRRVGLIRHKHGGVVLIGPGHAGDTLRLQRFLTRNGYPHRLLDTEVDPDAGGFLDCFELTPEQLPVVISPDHRVLRNPSTAALADRPRADRDARSRARLRRRRRRCRPGRARRRRLRRLGRAGHDRHRGHGARRPSGHLVQDRELSRLPDRDLRPSPRRPCADAGAEVRSAACDLAQCRRHRLLRSALPDQAR